MTGCWPRRRAMNQTRKTQSAPNLSGYSRIPSVSRAIPFACRGRSVDANSQLQVEFIGGTARWRFVEDEDEVPKSQKKHSKQVACSYARPSSKPCLHEVTIAGGWGQKSEREKRLEKLASKLGYLPGMPRMKGRLVVVLVRFSPGVQGWLEFDNYCGCWWKWRELNMLQYFLEKVTERKTCLLTCRCWCVFDPDVCFRIYLFIPTLLLAYFAEHHFPRTNAFL